MDRSLFDNLDNVDLEHAHHYILWRIYHNSVGEKRVEEKGSREELIRKELIAEAIKRRPFEHREFLVDYMERLMKSYLNGSGKVNRQKFADLALTMRTYDQEIMSPRRTG